MSNQAKPDSQQDDALHATDPADAAFERSTAPETGEPLGPLLGWGIGLLALAGLVTFLLHFGDFTVFVKTIRGADLRWLLAALACQILTYLCAAAVWSRVLKHAGAPMKLRSLLGLALVELFANQAVPTGGLSGSIMVVRGLVRRGIAPATAVTALVVAALSYYAAYLLVALSAFSLLWNMGDFSDAWASLLVIFAVILAVIAGSVVLLIRSHGNFIPDWARHWHFVQRFADLLAEVRMDVLGDGRLLAETIGLQAALFLIDSATLWCAARAVGLAVEPQQAFIAFLLASVVTTISPIPMGLGTFEGTSIGILHFFGASVESSLAATLLLRGFTLWLPMLPGLILIRRESRHHPARAVQA
nr:lysylphosphatidylglycerol synthase transmembrane domain-containing protein [uncultured Gellertiella sp.]